MTLRSLSQSQRSLYPSWWIIIISIPRAGCVPRLRFVAKRQNGAQQSLTLSHFTLQIREDPKSAKDWYPQICKLVARARLIFCVNGLETCCLNIFFKMNVYVPRKLLIVDSCYIKIQKAENRFLKLSKWPKRRVRLTSNIRITWVNVVRQVDTCSDHVHLYYSQNGWYSHTACGKFSHVVAVILYFRALG